MASNRWVVGRGRNSGARVRLFCFPYAGGSASVFRDWAGLLPSWAEVCPVQPPGRADRMAEPAFRRMAPLAEAAAAALLPSLDRPFVFFGHSLGAVVAFETIRRLRRIGGPAPILFAASGCRAPNLPKTTPDTFDLPPDDFVASLRRLGGTPEEILGNPEILAVVVPVLRADFELYQTYRFQAETPLACPIVGFVGRDDDHVSPAAVDAWRAATSGPFTLKEFPGGHFFPFVAGEAVVRSLGAEMEKVIVP